MPDVRIASPERRFRAAAAVLIGAWIGWRVWGSLRSGLPGGAPGALPLAARITVTCLAVAVGVCLAVLTMLTHLSVTAQGLADHRTFRVVRVPWPQITGFEIGRPGALWGGFCVIASCRDGSTVDLMSTRAYSRVPSAWHLDELERIRWSLEDAAARLSGD